MRGRRKPGRSNGAFRYDFASPRIFVELTKTLEGFGEDLADYSAVMAKMPEIFAESIGQNIASKGATIGQTWDRNSPAYLNRKIRGGYSRIDLVVSGRLLSHVTSPGGPETKIGKRGIVWKTRGIPYDIAVNFGRTAKGGHVTAIGRREFWGLNDTAKKKAFDLIEAETHRKLGIARERVDQIKAGKT